ncbi:MAG: phenylacetate--CoA ligase family protein [Anaerolineae bacterium]|nr:phenylacetate--CoA ligase family protein [Anaerolineae bacterium]MDW8171682.1 phenylacetate--CoA ligase family protein [Anaerolineae bacterium]
MSQTYFDQKIRDIIAHAYDKAPSVRAMLDKAGVTPADIQGAADLHKIPVLSKDALVEIHQANPPFGGFLTIDPADLPRIYISPGPIYDPQPPPEDPAILLEPFRYVGFGRGDRVLNTFTYHLTPAGILLDDGLRGVGATVIPTGPGNTDLQIMMVMALGINGFVGQPSYLMQILDKMESMGVAPEANPFKKALFSAEPYLPAQRARFEGQYGMKTTSAYGTADLGFIGYTRHDMPGFRIMPTVYVQIVDPTTGQDVEPGSNGEIVVTTFNKAYPLVRFGTGDLGALAADLVDGQQHLLGLFGRSGEAIKVRGMFLHPNQLRTAAAAFPAIDKIQAIITRPEHKDVVTLRVELKEGAEANNLGEQLMAAAQNAVRLRVDQVEFVPPGTIGNERLVRDDRKWE